MSIKGRFKVFGLLLVTAGVVSCIPVHETFYHPTGLGGKAVGPYCQGRTGPLKVFRFQHDRATVYTLVIYDEKQAKSIAINFWFVEPYTPLMKIVLPTDEFKIRTEGKEESLRLVGVHENLISIPPKDSLLLESYRGMHYRLELKPSRPIEYESVPEFTLVFPEMQIDGQPVTFPPIQWTLVKDQPRMVLVVSNC